MQQVHAEITEGVYDVLSVEKAVASRRSYGGTSPSEVLEQIERARERFL